MNYYDEQQNIIAVDENDKVIGPVEKWEAHKQGVLHRAFTVSLRFDDMWVVQHRKHPVFDSVLDVTCSSHPLFTKHNTFEEMEGVVVDTMVREWNLGDYDFNNITLEHGGKVRYQADDSMSDYKENEVCHVFVATLRSKPEINSSFAYGMSLVPEKVLFDKRNPLKSSFAPWVTPMIPLLVNFKTQ